jgi:hypothetical protein
MRGILAGSIYLSLVWVGADAWAQDGAWQPSLGRPMAVESEPVVKLGKPVAVSTGIEPTSYQEVESPSLPPVVRGQAPDPGPGLPAFPPAGPGTTGSALPALPPVGPGMTGNMREQYNCGMVNQEPPPPPNGFWDKCKGIFSFGKGNTFNTSGRHPFESDHSMDDFISPVTNPFLFEDPRSLTEARPIFMWQGTPTKTPIYRGGDIEYFGLQGRVAITECFSIVMNKFGAVWSEPHDSIPGFEPHDGFAEIWIGPKYTFLRNEGTGTLGAVGLIFQLPVGSDKVQQDTGNLTLTPYLTMGQSFFKTSYGMFHALGTLGYNASVDSERSDNVYFSLHFDYDIANLHKFYPLIEFNYFHYTSSGKARDLLPVAFEGRDLFNLGAEGVSGHNDLSMALGFRYKYNEHYSAGIAYEFPITGRRDLMDYRVTFDVIIRY